MTTKDRYTPGQDCGCYAYSESECGCDADWTPAEVYELREELARARKTIEGIQHHINRWVKDNSMTDAERKMLVLHALRREKERNLETP